MQSLPPPALPERRGAEILATVLHPHAVGHPLRLLVAVALLGLLLVGTLVAGGELLRDRGDDPFVVIPPVSLESSSPAETPRTAVVPSPTPAPSPTAPPQTPVLHMRWTVDTGWWTDATVVMADGLTFWNDPADGLRQRHLAPSGVAWVRSQLDANGLLDADAVHRPTQKPGTEPPGGGVTVYNFVSDREGTPVTVIAEVPGGSVDERYWTATDTLLRLVDLGAQIVDADAWIPGELWMDAAAPFEPTRYLFVAQMTQGEGPPTRDDVDTIDWPLPVPPDEYGERVVSPGSDGQVRCAVIDPGLATDIARAQAPAGDDMALTLGGSERIYGWTRGGGWMGISLYPLLPDETDCSARYDLPEPPALGDSWTAATVPLLDDRPVGRLEAVTAGGPGFVAVGRGCTGAETPACEGVVWTSVDGRAWDRVPASDATDTGAFLAMSGPEIGMFDVAAGPPGIVAIGYAARPDMAATTWFSPDGTSWERLPLGGADNLRLSAVAWSGRQFVVVGEDRPAFLGAAAIATAKARAAVWTSTDGRRWTRAPDTDAFDTGGFMDTMEDPASGGMADVVAGPGGLVAVGSYCTGTPMRCEPAAWSSPDGTTWMRVGGLPELAGSLSAVGASDAGFVAAGVEHCGTDLATCPTIILTSPDGTTWSRQPFDQAGGLTGIDRIGARLFATAPYGPETVWVSADSTTWTAGVFDGGPAGSGSTGVTDPCFAASGDTAVWLGMRIDTDEPAAWVSTLAGR